MVGEDGEEVGEHAQTEDRSEQLDTANGSLAEAQSYTTHSHADGKRGVCELREKSSEENKDAELWEEIGRSVAL